MEVSQLTVVLNLEDGKLALLALGEDIHTIELVVFVFLIGLALKEAHDGELLVQERSHQASSTAWFALSRSTRFIAQSKLIKFVIFA